MKLRTVTVDEDGKVQLDNECIYCDSTSGEPGHLAASLRGDSGAFVPRAVCRQCYMRITKYMGPGHSYEKPGYRYREGG